MQKQMSERVQSCSHTFSLSLPPFFPQIGNLTGSTEWQNSGKQVHAEGEGELKAAQAKAYGEGLVDQGEL